MKKFICMIGMVFSLSLFARPVVLVNPEQDEDILFKVNDGGSIVTPMAIQGSSGYIGIGTTNPTEKLDSYGKIRARSGTISGAQSNIGTRAIAFDSSLLHFSTAADGLVLSAATYTDFFHFYNAAGTVSESFLRHNNADDTADMYISGKVGIGTSSPTVPLEIKSGSDATTVFVASSSTGRGISVISGGPSTAPEIQSFGTGNGLLLKSSGGGNQLFLKNDGYVGIGTNNPVYKLDVNGEARVATNLRFSSGTACGNATSPCITTATGTGVGIFFEADKVGFGTGASTKYSYLNTTGDWVVNGSVGIGVSPTNGKLHINDTGTTTNGIYIEGTQTSGHTAYFYTNSVQTGNTLRVYQDGAGSTGAALYVHTDGTTAAVFNSGNVGIGKIPTVGLDIDKDTAGDYGFKFVNGSATGGGLYIYGGSNSTSYNLLALDNLNGNKFVVRSDGNVGIGTVAPGAKLEIYNNASAGPSWSQYLTFNTAAERLLKIGLNSANNLAIQAMKHDDTVARSFTLNPDGGYVGIGTSSPGDTAHIYSTGAYGLTIDSTTFPSLKFAVSGALKHGIQYYNGGLNIYRSGVDYEFFIKDDGNVGIGTNDTQGKLTIKSSGLDTNTFYIISSDSQALARILENSLGDAELDLRNAGQENKVNISTNGSSKFIGGSSFFGAVTGNANVSTSASYLNSVNIYGDSTNATTASGITFGDGTSGASRDWGIYNGRTTSGQALGSLNFVVSSAVNNNALSGNTVMTINSAGIMSAANAVKLGMANGAGLFPIVTVSGNSCDTHCADNETGYGFSNPSGTCLKAWDGSYNVIACNATTATRCLCAGSF